MRTGELGEREIKDYGELTGWLAAQPWSNGRVGVYGTSYEGQAAELMAGLGHLTWSRWRRCSARMTRAARLGRMLIRDATLDDWPRIWLFIGQIAAAGETFSWDRDITEDGARDGWFRWLKDRRG